MFYLIVKDIMLQKKTLILTFVYIAIFSFSFGKQTSILSAVTCMIIYMMLAGSFAYDEKAKIDSVLCSMPISRDSIVLSKYVSMFVYTAFGYAIYFILYEINNLFKLPLNIMPMTGIDMFAALFAGLLFGSVSIPFIFKFGFIRSRYFLIIFFLGGTFGIILLGQLKAFEALKPLLSYFLTLPGDIIVAILSVFILILVSVSFLISKAVYAKKEF